MTELKIKTFINENREIEFDYNGKRYSITYFYDNGIRCISFCEFYQEPVDFKNIDDLMEYKLNSIKLKDLFNKLADNQFDIF